MKLKEKLDLLREHMRKEQVDAVYVGTSDPHQSESVAAHWKSVQWLTGYTGSVGLCIVTETEAAFWTDGRYTSQAKREVDESQIEIYTVATPGEPEWDEWLSERLTQGTLAVDGTVMSVETYRDFARKLKNVAIRYDWGFMDLIWKDRPEIPRDPVYELEIRYAGITRKDKLEQIRKYMRKKGRGVQYYLVNCLDDIAWLCNMRGNDNPLYPFFHAYVLLHREKAWLCMDLNKVSEELKRKLTDDGFQLCPYEWIGELLQKIPKDGGIYLDPFKTSYLLYQKIPCSVEIQEGMDWIAFLKSRRSQKEQENIRQANLYECAAVVRFMKYIEENLEKESLDEYHLGKKLEDFRRMCPEYIQPANIPIVGYAENAALPHYRPSEKSSVPIGQKGFLLFDVCAQYCCGTTDLTRTIAVGELTEEMKEDYTLTLQSHIALARQKFPYGVTGNVLDTIAKSMHWNRCMQYKTGTGHGIGYISNVHEGVCKIMMDYTSMFPYALTEPLDSGMLFSNEPGVYKPGRHGIRIENSILVQEAEKNEFGRFLRFETITFLPFERRAILEDRLTKEEREWINDYYDKTRVKLSPYLDEEENAWLYRKTMPL